MSKFCLSVSMALTLSLWPVSANADWQFTKWGMSPEQVIAASNGTAVSAKPKMAPPFPQRLATIPQFQSGNLGFSVDFLFSPQAKKLIVVRLAQDLGAPVDLFDALKVKYGVPYVGAGDEADVVVQRIWTRAGDDIFFTWVAGFRHATLAYKPHDPTLVPKDRRNGDKL